MPRRGIDLHPVSPRTALQVFPVEDRHAGGVDCHQLVVASHGNVEGAGGGVVLAVADVLPEIHVADAANAAAVHGRVAGSSLVRDEHCAGLGRVGHAVRIVTGG